MSTDRTHISLASGIAPPPATNTRLPLRLPSALLTAVRQHAEEEGETLSTFCRRALRQTIARDHLTHRLQRERDAFRHGIWADHHSRHPSPADGSKKETRA